MNPFTGILVFSAIETAAVIVWAIIVFRPEAFSSAQVLGGIVLFIGYVVEHIVAFNVGKGRGFFEKIRP